ncbi:hypothetical protein ANO11243_039830 [Dothideomycetidae sp. 11243]|nr:hypothetical protein ANO11243_039830 [fungal sp. No.11243]
MQHIVLERAKRGGSVAPPYDFLELIGKGTFGRVYKCKNRATRKLAAVKIIDVDELDYRIGFKDKDEAIADFVKEVNALKQVKDSNARNINQIQEAFDLHSQLWIVSDYCSGGSVHTLMKVHEGRGLDERYIIPIARELAIALKHVHDAGVIHRDIKCGNILISEDGQLQLCDFGVAAVVESEASKRSTIIGTPYWMAPEMHPHGSEDIIYGKDIDCWAFGCTLFEMATGMPPYHQFHPQYLKSVLKSVPRLDEEADFSQGLRNFVAFCLQERPEDRPKAKQIIEHPYIAGTEEAYPTTILLDLIDRYVQWEWKGGQRLSLFNAMGAAAPQMSGQPISEENWIFSTTDEYEKSYEQRYSRMLEGISGTDFAAKTPHTIPAEIDLPSGPGQRLTPLEAAKEEQRAQRGEKFLERLFDSDRDPYDYNETKMDDDLQPLSDLPLRNLSDERSANRETLIDLDTSGLELPPTFNFDFSDMPTLKANRKSSMPNLDDIDDGGYYDAQDRATKRATKDWKFPGFAVNGTEDAKRATKDWKFPRLAEEDAENKKRATKDWKFPSLPHTTKASLDQGNRRTMDWTFSNAQTIPEGDSETQPSLISQSIEEEPFRPTLPRMVTEPAMAATAMDQPLQLSLDTGVAGDRESRPMIDLDFGTGFQPSLSFDAGHNGLDIMRSVSPVSAAPSFTSVGPFDLEQDHDRRADDSNGFPPRSGSLSVAERRLSRLQKPSKTSFGSHLMPTRARGASVDSTASSLVDEACDESIYGKQYNRTMNAKMRDQLRAGLQRSASAADRHSRNLTDESFGDADTDSSYIADGTHGRVRSVSAMGYDTDSSYQGEQRVDIVPSSFPTLVPPRSAALVEGAPNDMLLDELDKILGSAQQAFAYTTLVLRNKETEIEGETPVDSATESGPLDMTSEEEAELANFS